MSRVMELTNKNETEVQMFFECPGCNIGHSFRIKGKGPIWTWNNDTEKPTFSPSLLVRWHKGGIGGTKEVCHSFVKNGQIQFLSDCTHHLAGKTVDLKEE